MRANVALNEDCIEAFDVLIANGVDAPVTDAPITAVFRTTDEVERMMRELRELEKAGQTMYVTALSGEALREQVPLASPAVTAGLNINAQRFVDPRRFVEALGRSVVVRGATIHRLEIRDILTSGSGVAVHPRNGKPLTADAAVIATGARLSQLAGRCLRVPVQAGHGYSFTVPVDRPIPSPIYLPDARVACTPYKGAIRVSGTTEFRHPHHRVIPERVEAIVAAAGPLLDGARWAERSNLWVGAYPVTPDGRALIGEVSPGVYVAGGHGMWGLAHGPVTGRLLAEQITTGKQPEALRELRSAAPKRPLALPIPASSKAAARLSPTKGAPSRQGRLLCSGPPLTTPSSTRKDINHNDQHPTHPDDATGLHPTAPGTCRAALAAQHRRSRRFHGLRRESHRGLPSATSTHPRD